MVTRAARRGNDRSSRYAGDSPLSRGTGPRNPRGVIRSKPHIRLFVQALCVAFVVAWVGAANVGTANAVEHALAIPHEHGAMAAMVGELSDHDDGHHAREDADHHGNDGAPAPDHPTGLSHHHADAPTGVPAASGAMVPAHVANGDPLTIANDRTAVGLSPGGLKRPPRTSDIVV